MTESTEEKSEHSFITETKTTQSTEKTFHTALEIYL